MSIFLIIPLSAPGDVYKWVDKSGVIHFTNVPTEKKFKRIIKEGKGTKTKNVKVSQKSYVTTKVSDNQGINQAQDYSVLIHSISEKYQIDPVLVKAIIKAESNFRADAISRKGARGLMQLMPGTANDLNVKNVFNPEENIEGGVRYFKYLLGLFGGDISLSLAAYNAGPEAVQRAGRIPSIKETQHYVRKVLTFYNGTGVIGFYNEPIYQIVSNDGTIVFTNIPHNYRNQKRVKKM